jgi:hypothetical protein
MSDLATEQDDGATSGCIKTLVALAEGGRLARIFYCKLTEREPTQRVIEPYRFLDHGPSLMVQSWQIDPAIAEGSAWRNFRCDCIKDVSDGGATFAPRRPVELHLGTSAPFMSLFRPAKKKADPVAAYRDYLIDAIRDHELTQKEIDRAGNLAQKVPMQAMKVVHAQVFSEVLLDALLDHQISEEEEAFIDSVRGFMETAGWAP